MIDYLDKRFGADMLLDPDLTEHPDWEIIPAGELLKPGDHVWWSAKDHRPVEFEAADIPRFVGNQPRESNPYGFYRRPKAK